MRHLVFITILAAAMTSGSSALAQTASAQRPAAAPAVPAPVPGPTMVEAMKALEASRAAAAKLGVAFSCAVVDARGDLIALARMDGARFFTADVARGKALTSALFGQPSGALGAFGNSPAFQNFNAAAQGRLYALQGALPILKNNQPLGAIGCSGGNSQQDEEVARAGLALF